MTRSSRIWDDRFRITSIIIAIVMLVGAFGILIGPITESAIALPEVSDRPWSGDYMQPIADDILGFENMSRNARPLFANTTTGDVYLTDATDEHHTLLRYNHATGTYSTLFTFPENESVWSGDRIRAGIICADGSILISQFATPHIYRSTDLGVTFVDVFDISEGADAWYFTTRGRYVYTAEYANSTEYPGNRVWMSTDNGRNGTWSAVARGYTEGAGIRSHWHRMFTDPYTNYVYAWSGDAANLMIRSTDGINFYQWGDFIRPIAMTADAYNLYFGDDPPGRIVIYNKTTLEWRIEFWMYDHRAVQSPFYDMTIGNYGVLYGRTTDEALAPHWFGILISPNGRDWAMVRNMSHTTSIYGESDYHVVNDGKGHIWYGDTSAVGTSQFNAWAYRMNDITKVEAYAIVKQREPRTVASTIDYSDGRRGYDGGTDYAYFGQDVLMNAKLNITGVSSQNRMPDGQLDTVVDCNGTWGVDGWTWRDPETPEQNDNKTISFTSAKYHSAPYSVKLSAVNSTGSHGKSRIIADLAPNDIPAGSNVMVSFYYSHENNNPNTLANFNDNYTYLTSTATIVYGDWDADSLGGIVGYAGNYIYSNGNMSGNSWARAWSYPSTIDAKDGHKLIVDFYFTGIGSIYIDDIMLEVVGGTYSSDPTLAMRKPFIPDTTTIGSTNINITVNGVRHAFSNLADGAKAEVSLGTISGLMKLDFEINGSRCVNWTIIGDRVASTYNSLVSLEDGLIKANYVYPGHHIEFWSSGTISPASFISPLSTDTSYMTVSPSGAPVNLTVSTWIATNKVWIANASGSPTVTFTLSGLDSGKWYRVEVDGETLTNIQASGGSISFTYSGPWSEHEFEVTALPAESSTDQIKNLIPWAIGLVILFVVIGFAIMAYREGFDFTEIIELVAFLIIGLSIYTIVTQFFG